jgi:hypothetical protein
LPLPAVLPPDAAAGSALFRGSVGSGVGVAAEAGVDSFFGPYPAGKLAKPPFPQEVRPIGALYVRIYQPASCLSFSLSCGFIIVRARVSFCFWFPQPR